MRRAPATAKLNLALVVGPRRADGRHEVATVLQRLDLADRVAVEPAAALRVEGFAEDTLVRSALESVAEAAGVEPRWPPGSRSRSRSRLGSAAAAPTPRPRSGSRTRRSPSRSPHEPLHELAAGARRRRALLPTAGRSSGRATARS